MSIYGLRLYGKKKGAAVAMLAAGAGLVARSLVGRDARSRWWPARVRPRGTFAAVDRERSVKVTKSITVNRPAPDLFRFWRDFQNLPLIMSHLESVEIGSHGTWHWIARGPAGTRVAWDAEIINEEENRLIAWRSVEGAEAASAGSVRFSTVPGERGTAVTIELKYEPLGGRLGAALAKLLGEAPEQQIADDLWRFKQLMETGEIPTTSGQPSGAHHAHPLKKWRGES